MSKPLPKPKPSARRSVDDLINAATVKPWAPPPHLLPELNKLLEHNRNNPMRRVGIRKIKSWLSENGVEVGREVLGRWLQTRSAS